MANPWFRMYSEFADDPKVQMMSEQDQRRLAMLFCERCKAVKHDETLRAFHWRITPLELSATKAVFLANGFIDDNWNVLNWNRRQYLSDSSTERVRQHRGRKKQGETLHSPDVTAPDTEADTETDAKDKQKPYPNAPNSASDGLSKEDEKKLRAELKAAERAAAAAAKTAAKSELRRIAAEKKISMKAAKPPTKSDAAAARHSEFKVAIFEYWKSKNPGFDCPWEQPEGKQLELWLRSSPTTTITRFKEMLRHRYRSEVVHSERPSVWIRNITSYANGPLNAFKQPLNSGGIKTNGKSADRAFETASKLIQEIEDHHGAHAGELLSGSGAN